jgi:glutamate formiminotransferase/formiminotetrahydrofolate cyclodeaminase
MAGRHYLEKQGKSPGVPEEELIRMAIRSLGLNDVAPFEPEKKIIEYQVREPGRALVDMTLRGFADELSMDSPAPGGGSVAALCGALSAGLAAMVANLTVGKKGYAAVCGDMIDTAVRAQALKDALLEAVDADTRAFNKVMEAFRLPKTTPEQAEEKDRAVEEANKGATLVPLDVLEKSVEAVGLAKAAAAMGNKNSISDAGVAGLAGQAAGEGAYYNVLINLAGIKDGAFADRVRRKAAGFKKALDKEGKAVRDIIAKALAAPKAA